LVITMAVGDSQLVGVQLLTVDSAGIPAPVISSPLAILPVRVETPVIVFFLGRGAFVRDVPRARPARFLAFETELVGSVFAFDRGFLGLIYPHRFGGPEVSVRAGRKRAQRDGFRGGGGFVVAHHARGGDRAETFVSGIVRREPEPVVGAEDDRHWLV
jgi:hypothetical protein